MTSKLEDVVGLAQQSVKRDQQDRLIDYLKVFTKRLPAKFVKVMYPQTLLTFAMERFEFMTRDLDSPVKVSIHDPSPSLSFLDENYTVVETRLPDCNFIVKTLKKFFQNRGIQIRLVVHPVFAVRIEDEDIVEIHSEEEEEQVPDEDSVRFSQIYLHVEPIPYADREWLTRSLSQRLEALLQVNEDFLDFRAQIGRIRAALTEYGTRFPERQAQFEEARDLLDWFANHNFLFWGYRYYPVEGEEPPKRVSRPLGLFREEIRIVRDMEEEVERILDWEQTQEQLASVYRSDAISPFKSEVPMRFLGFKELDGRGEPIGNHVFLGLLSTNAVRTANSRIPLISRKMFDCLDEMGLRKGSYLYKKHVAILNSIPNEDMFFSTVEEITKTARFIFEADLEEHTRVFVYRRPGTSRIAVTCVIPRSGYSDALKEEAEGEICRFLGVPRVRDYVREDDEERTIRMHFYVGSYDREVDDEEIERLSGSVMSLLETWEEKFRDLLLEAFPAPVRPRKGSAETLLSGEELLSKYHRAFPDVYRETQPAEMAVLDVGAMERLERDAEPQVVMTLVASGNDVHTSLRIYSNENLTLNAIVPILQNMDLRAKGRLSVKPQPKGSRPVWLAVFEVMGPEMEPITHHEDLQRLSQILRRVLLGELPNGPLCSLGWTAKLSWREIDLLTTYRNFFCQVFQGYTIPTVEDVLLRNRTCTRLLIRYFHVRFNTRDETGARERLLGPLKDLKEDYTRARNAVSSIQDDLILRLFFSLFENTLRTSYYQEGTRTIALKIDCKAVEDMPRPRPMYEIYVHGPGFEGVHLRGGKIARGGIRWSERLDDFRREVLGLMKTQMTKNSVIVPVGAKGGFIIRNTFDDRARMEEEVRTQYKHFISGLLDLTDNYVEGNIVPPEDVIRYDDDDPYLVVAADKGTAHLSDTANAISKKYDFWLGDAFASGGSTGYDHKKMGITARGAWECVKRHFRELGTDIDETSIRAVGIGDMSGDVFGNGMLLNDKLQLVGAFNHKHIFIDPDPDPAASYAERKRLFEMPRSSWTDYDPEVLSPGGAIYDRYAKQIDLSPEAIELFGLSEEEAASLNGPKLIKLVMTCDADLLWFGGIGTYVKASEETHVQVGDKVNDNVRVDACDLKVDVLGEGANLGMTARARTEYLAGGGLCNSDAVDNSGGVDASDHEVNLKILFTDLLKKKKIESLDVRNELLEEVKSEVAEDILANNYHQSQLISLEGYRSKRDVESFIELLDHLTRHADLYRAGEFISKDEVLREWHSRGRSITRNQLAVIVAYMKNYLREALLETPIPDHPFFKPFLVNYFPSKIGERFREDLNDHPLRREIVATELANSVINTAGVTFLWDRAKEADIPMPDVLVRYVICSTLMNGTNFRRAVEELDNKAAAADQYQALLAFEDTLNYLVRWWGWNADSWALTPADLEGAKERFAKIRRGLIQAIGGRDRQEFRNRVNLLISKGFGKRLSRKIASLKYWRHGFSLLRESDKPDRPDPVSLARLFYRVGYRLHLTSAREILAAQPLGTIWDKRFHAVLQREIATFWDSLLSRILDSGDSLDSFEARHKERFASIGAQLSTLQARPGDNRVPLFIILEEYRALLQDTKP